nr:carboxypeptidase regulatory-like domain-containing protein [Bacteroidota bacterium]
MKKFLLAALLIGFAATCFSQAKVIIRFQNPDAATVKTFTRSNYDVAAYKPGSFLDLVVLQNEFERLVDEGYDISIIKTEAEMAANLGNTDDINGYRTYAEAVEELQQIANDYPDICKLIDIGDSRGKEYYESGYGNYGSYQHDIWALKLSDNVLESEDEPAVYYFGAHHAREPLSTEVAFYVLNHLIDNYGTDPEITANVNSTEIWFVPIVNPDGHEVVLNQIDLNWRKNIRDNDGNGSLTLGGWYYPDGVDANRNYGWEWGGEGTSHDPDEITYCGPEPFSEPEMQAIKSLVEQNHFVAGLSYHTYSELVLWPYGYTNSAVAPDVDALAGLGTMIGESIPGIYSGHYTPQAAWELYSASGVTDDWVYGQHGIFGYTVELGVEFIPPASQVYQITEDNLEGALILLNRINYSTLTGHVTNSNTGDPMVAEIFIEGIDDTGSPRDPYMSDDDFGTYYRMLTDGSYTVTFSSFGYISQTFENVVISSEAQTILDVELEQSEIIAVSGTVTDSDGGSPIAGATVEVLNAPIDPVFTNELGQYEIPEIFQNSYTFRIWAMDYATLLQVVSVSNQNNIIDFELTESNAFSFEEGMFGNGWTFGGNANWVIDNTTAWDGSNSAKSGNINDMQTSQIIYTVETVQDGEITFFRKVSSEPDYDYLEFYIDNVKKDEWAGEQDWEEFAYDVAAGQHTFKWVYDKDQNTSNGDDCGWVDFIIFPLTATLSAQAGSDGEICEDDTFQCEGNATLYNTLEWATSGDGMFSDATILNPVYTPGTNDILSAIVTLTMTAYDEEGNSDADDLALTINPLPASGTAISGSAVVCAGSTELYSCETITNAESYEWVIEPDYAGSVAIYDNEITINWMENYFGDATLTVRGENDCGFGGFSNGFVVTVEDCTGIGETDGQAVVVFPNPASDHIVITLQTTGEQIYVNLVNILGSVVYEVTLSGQENGKINLDVKDLENGIYFLNIKSAQLSVSKKLVIKQ